MTDVALSTLHLTNVQLMTPSVASVAINTTELPCAILVPPHIHSQGTGTPPASTRDYDVQQKKSVVPVPTREIWMRSTTKTLEDSKVISSRM